MTAKSKVALVTGGSRGLGREMVLNLARNGVNIIFTYKSNKEEAAKLVAEVISIGQRAVAYQLDLSRIAAFDNFADDVIRYLQVQEGLSTFDFLINNAGIGAYGSVSETSEEIFDSMMNVNFKGVYFLTQKLLPYLSDGGRIVNISSGLTRVSFPNVSAYASSKGAIEIFSRCLAKELGTRGITVNTISPGAIATDFGGGTNKTDDAKRQAISNITALGRVGIPEDIGGVVAFLCSPEAGWINGQRIELSGGMLL